MLFNLRSLAVPKYFKNYGKYLKIGDKLVKIYLVTQLPEEFDFGLLPTAFANLDNTRYFYKAMPLSKNMDKEIQNELNNLEEKYNKEKNDVRKDRLAADINKLKLNIQDLIASNNYVMDMMMGIFVFGDNEIELKDNCARVVNRLNIKYGFKLLEINEIQEELYKEFIPLFKQTGLVKTLQYNYRIPISSRSLAGLWHYHYEEVKDYKGYLIGYEATQGGLVKFNPFLWLDDKDVAHMQNINAGNIFIPGSTGSGKTTLLNKLYESLVKQNVDLIWIDPENVNQYLVEKYGGKYIFFGLPNNIINVLELRRIGVDEDENIDTYDTSIAISNAIRDFKEVLKLYHENDLKDVHTALNVIDDIVIEAYKRKGINNPSFKNYSSKDYPIIEDVYNILVEKINQRKTTSIGDDYVLAQYTKLEVYIKPLILSEAKFFNGHTNVNFNEGSNILGFGTKLLNNVNQTLKNAIFFLIMQHTAAFAYQKERRSALLLDELHQYALAGFSLPILSDLTRRVRKYNTINIMATQEPADLTSPVLVNGVPVSNYGRAILNNTTYMFLMYLKKEAADGLNTLLDLSEIELNQIKQFKKGQAIFVKGQQHYFIQVYCNQEELKEFVK